MSNTETVTVNSSFSNKSNNLTAMKLFDLLDELKIIKKCDSSFINNLQVEREIGSGGFGVVYMATDKQTGNKYIIKKITHINNKQSNDVINEIKNHFIISGKCKNICKIVCAYIEGIYTTGSRKVDYEDDYIINIVQEYCGIELSKKIEDKNSSVMDVYVWTEQLLNALECIHENNLVHFDIKPNNILIDKNNNLKLIDFGLCKEGKCKFFGGTLKYLHKDIFNSDVKYVDYRNDCYAAGLTIKEMWNSLELKELPKNIENLINELVGTTYELIPPIKEIMKKYLGAHDDIKPNSSEQSIYTFEKFNEMVDDLVNLELIDEDEIVNEDDKKPTRQQVYNDLIKQGVKKFDSKILKAYPYLKNP